LLTLIDVAGCENPSCREFGRIAACPANARACYCHVCGTITRARVVDATLVSSPERYDAYLRDALSREKELVLP
ncbi:MAG: hypothetical protein ACE5FA_10210, partial [Dehalococcoidia bacterium]